ncbi:Putative regulatory protein associated with the ectoine operon [gamma proteobacterium IMCC2047]|nr:Putative regulatory protein associated with the ectoine operon [gamma proteobacterium IMCC2047]
MGSLAKDVSLSQATVTNILDRLEAKELVVRERSTEDKRKVFTQLTAKARVVLEGAPLPLQDQFARQFEELQEWEQAMMISALQRIAQMMDAETIDAAPVLDVGLLDRQAPATDNPTVSSDD